MKAGVVVFPGSNCDQDLVDALHLTGFREVVRLWHKQTDLESCDLIFLPGGFSYGDYLRSGAIARFSPVMKEVSRFAARGGFVMGICNGFQILTEAGLLPGALVRNRDRLFICDYVALQPATRNSRLTAGLDPGRTYTIPIAHGEGRYIAPPEVLAGLEEEDRILFRYTGNGGNPADAANPNGSQNSIAGVMNKERNVLGMMPHPERVADPRLGKADGRALFLSLLHSFS